MTWVEVIAFLIIAGLWCAILGGGGLIVWGLLRAWRWWRGRREREELANEFLLRAAMQDAERLKMLSRDDTQ